MTSTLVKTKFAVMVDRAMILIPFGRIAAADRQGLLRRAVHLGLTLAEAEKIVRRQVEARDERTRRKR